jgi:hypothetical protein
VLKFDTVSHHQIRPLFAKGVWLLPKIRLAGEEKQARSRSRGIKPRAWSSKNVVAFPFLE